MCDRAITIVLNEFHHRSFFYLCLSSSEKGLENSESVSARPSELEGRHFDPRHSIDVSFDFPLFRLAVALNTRKTEN